VAGSDHETLRQPRSSRLIAAAAAANTESGWCGAVGEAIFDSRCVYFGKRRKRRKRKRG